MSGMSVSMSGMSVSMSGMSVSMNNWCSQIQGEHFLWHSTSAQLMFQDMLYQFWITFDQ